MQQERAFPVRLGIEGIAGALGIEIGASATYHATPCGGAQTGGVYGVAHIYAPITAKARLVFEGGGYFVVAQYTTQSVDFDSMCFGPHVWQSYAGWMGAGLEWSL